MKCPVCNMELIVVERQRIELDYCIQCRGIWFDAGEIKLLAETLQVNAKLPDFASLPKENSFERPRRCPRCAKPMDKVRAGKPASILIDRCPDKDGVWLDPGELGRMMEQYRLSGGEGEPMIQFLSEAFPK